MDSGRVGAFVAQLRREKGLTQQELADRLGVTNKAVSKWETGEGYPEITMLPALADALGVTADELLRGERAARACAPESMAGEEGRESVAGAKLRFRNMSLVAGALAAAGLVAFYVITWASCLEVVGFGVMMAFLIGSFILFIIQFNNLKAAQPPGGPPAGSGKAAAALIYLWTLSLSAALPYLLFDNGFYMQSILAFPDYASMFPGFMLLGALAAQLICHLAAKPMGIPGLPFESPGLRKTKLRLNLLSLLFCLVISMIAFAAASHTQSPGGGMIGPGVYLLGVLVFAACAVAVLLRGKTGSIGILSVCAVRNLVCSLLAAAGISSSIGWFSSDGSGFMQMAVSYESVIGSVLVSSVVFAAFTAIVWFLEYRKYKNRSKGLSA